MIKYYTRWIFVCVCFLFVCFISSFKMSLHCWHCAEFESEFHNVIPITRNVFANMYPYQGFVQRKGSRPGRMGINFGWFLLSFPKVSRTFAIQSTKQVIDNNLEKTLYLTGSQFISWYLAFMSDLCKRSKTFLLILFWFICNLCFVCLVKPWYQINCLHHHSDIGKGLTTTVSMIYLSL